MTDVSSMRVSFIFFKIAGIDRSDSVVRSWRHLV
jgi:hypothetical protein